VLQVTSVLQVSMRVCVNVNVQMCECCRCVSVPSMLEEAKDSVLSIGLLYKCVTSPPQVRYSVLQVVVCDCLVCALDLRGGSKTEGLHMDAVIKT
jgi:hypothetical protein